MLTVFICNALDQGEKLMFIHKILIYKKSHPDQKICEHEIPLAAWLCTVELSSTWSVWQNKGIYWSYKHCIKPIYHTYENDFVIGFLFLFYSDFDIYERFPLNAFVMSYTTIIARYSYCSGLCYIIPTFCSWIYNFSGLEKLTQAL